MTACHQREKCDTCGRPAGPFGSCGFPDFCDCDQRNAVTFASKRHGDLPAPNMEQLLEPDPELYLAGGPLAPDLCECDGLCTCDGGA